MTPGDELIEVALPLPVFHTFTYRVPAALVPSVAVGKRVVVPLGQSGTALGQRSVAGYVLGPGAASTGLALKEVAGVIDDRPLFPQPMVPFFRWVADYYLYPIGRVIAAVLPADAATRVVAVLHITERGREALVAGDLADGDRALLQALGKGPVDQHRLRNAQGPGFAQQVDRLVKAGLVAGRRKVVAKPASGATQRVVRLLRSQIPADQQRPNRQKILEALAVHGPMSPARLKTLVDHAPSVLGYLERNGFVAIDRLPLIRDPFGEPIVADVPPVLNQEQRSAVDRVMAELGHGYRTFMLAGVTGSGKTEVYLHLVSATLAKSRGALVLVPEIALMAQMTRRFRARFGDSVALLHSGLTAAERRDQWMRIASGQTRIVIGARSALFAPLNDLGLIIVDEEHDPSYKQESGLRYNARDLAVVRAKDAGAVALLGSATPSVQTHHNTITGKFVPLRLTRRVLERPLPLIEVVDLRQHHGRSGDMRFVSPQLQAALSDTLARGHQALLFLNRRGFAPHPICGACGQSLRCRHCTVSLTLHHAANAFRCHFCGFSQPATSRCPFCGADKIKALGLGTEKLEHLVRGLLPGARVARLDRDSTAARGALLKILRDIQNGAIDIVVGTQMVAKGHDFANITLVGIICADLCLNVPDFRAGERTFQILAQVAGRAGRGQTPGRVILQTFNPSHFGISAAQSQDFEAFYRQEIGYRRQLRYPPFSRLALLTVSGRDPDGTRNHAVKTGHCLVQVKNDLGIEGVDVLGPAEAAIARLAGRHRWQLLVKAMAGGPLNRLLGALMQRCPELFRNKAVRVAVDIDPMDMM